MQDFYHYFYASICYIPYAFGMIVLLLYSPALALFPRLSANPLTFTAIPIVSMVVINGLGLGLFYFNVYQHFVVLGMSILLFLIAFIRQIILVRTDPKGFEWNSTTFDLLKINVSIILPMIALCGLSVFMTDDALISWNFWARLNYAHISSATVSAGYPQFYPFFLSICYKLLGTTEYQGPVKVLLVIFPFTLLNVLSFSSPNISRSLLRYLFIAVICVFPGFLSFNFYRFCSVGYADPVLAASLVVSVWFLLLYCEQSKSVDNNKKNQYFLMISVLSGIAASLSKQPGFLWALWGFPLILLTKAFETKKIMLREVIALFFIFFPVVIWLCTSGKFFMHNTGVIRASLGSQSVTGSLMFSALGHSLLKYWIKQPTLLLLYIGAYICSRDSRYQKNLFWGVVIPGTLLWFTFGSYDVRLGYYLLVLCGLLICKNFDYSSETLKINTLKFSRISLLLGLLFFIFFSFREQNIIHEGVQDHLYPLNASKTLIYRYFGDGAEYVYNTIYLKPEKKIWISTFYISPIFYGNNTIIKAIQSASPEIIYDQIQKTKPDYLFTSGKIPTLSSEGLLLLQKKCPLLLTEIPLRNPHYQYRLFQLKTDNNDQTACGHF